MAQPSQKKDNARKIRAELNLEQWAIWQPSRSKHEAKPRTLMREKVLANGDKITSVVEINATTRGTLTTEDQKTYYALIEIWEESKIKNDVTYFSIRQIARKLGKKWGTRNIETIVDSLSQTLPRYSSH